MGNTLAKMIPKNLVVMFYSFGMILDCILCPCSSYHNLFVGHEPRISGTPLPPLFASSVAFLVAPNVSGPKRAASAVRLRPLVGRHLPTICLESQSVFSSLYHCAFEVDVRESLVHCKLLDTLFY